MPHLTSLSAKATLLDVYRKYPSIARHTLGLAAAAFDLTAELSHAECELLGAYISALNSCAYCTGIHTEAAVAAGITRDAYAHIADGAAPAYGGLSADAMFYEQAGKRLASVGYAGTAKMLGVAS